MDSPAPVAVIPSFALERPRKVHIALVLDRSGSMESCRQATIDGFNGYLAQVRAFVREQAFPATGSLTIFSDDVALDPFMASLEELRPLSMESYMPDGCTALLDAVGITIERLETATGGGSEYSFLVCIVSDGYENASRQYAAQEIARTISRLTERGNWTFTYLGANQDLSQVSEDLNIPQGNMAAYDATPDGTQDAWAAHATSTLGSVRRMRSGERSSRQFYEGDASPDKGDAT